MKRDDKTGTLQRVYSDISIRAFEGEGNERKFHLSFSSEEPYARYWGTEILSHSNEAVDLTRLNTIGCVLFNHDKYRVVAKILNASIVNGRGECDIEFDTDADSELIMSKVISGSLKGVSVGYVVDVWEDVAAGKTSADGFNGPCSIARKWTPYEVSIVSVPADPTVGVGRALDNEGVSGFYYAEKQLQINNNYKRR